MNIPSELFPPQISPAFFQTQVDLLLQIIPQPEMAPPCLVTEHKLQKHVRKPFTGPNLDRLTAWEPPRARKSHRGRMVVKNESKGPGGRESLDLQPAPQFQALLCHKSNAGAPEARSCHSRALVPPPVTVEVWT